MNKPLKAYEVREPDEGHACIVFAKSGAAARREGANELNTEWEYVESCRRAKHFDEYAPGPVPNHVLIEAGWWFTCHNCERRVSEDMADDIELEDEALNPDAFTPTFVGSSVYCGPACAAQAWRRTRNREEAIDAYCELIEQRFPGCVAAQVNIYDDWLVPSEEGHGAYCSAFFHFPGGTAGVRHVFGEDVVHVCQIDVDAWHSYYDPIKPKKDQN